MDGGDRGWRGWGKRALTCSKQSRLCGRGGRNTRLRLEYRAHRQGEWGSEEGAIQKMGPRVRKEDAVRVGPKRKADGGERGRSELTKVIAD